jgi:hypothetical protein
MLFLSDRMFNDYFTNTDTFTYHRKQMLYHNVRERAKQQIRFTMDHCLHQVERNLLKNIKLEVTILTKIYE